MSKDREDNYWTGICYVLGLTAAGVVLTAATVAIGLDGWAGTLAVSVPLVVLALWGRTRLAREKDQPRAGP